jgi:hypothetical protein
MRVGRAVLGGILIAAAGSDLCNPLNVNIQGFKLLTDDALRHPLAEFLYQKLHTAVIWKPESVKTHTLPLVKGSQGADRGSDTVSC